MQRHSYHATDCADRAQRNEGGGDAPFIIESVLWLGYFIVRSSTTLCPHK